jgi:CubicO group peptidase (beta-lactamase class C family)
MLYRYIRNVIVFFVAVGLISVSLTSHNRVAASNLQQADYTSRLDTFLLTQMETYKIPGLAIAIVRNGEVEYQNGYGIANSDGDPVTPDTPFLLASVSKSFTALAIMQLIEEGKINLNDPVQKYLPWFDVKGEGESEITVAHLVYQTSGFNEYQGNESNLHPASPNGLEEGVRALSNVNLTFNPGESWSYSNINYSVLGLLVQEVSGQRYENYIHEKIFTPLAMNHSYTSSSLTQDASLAQGYNPFFGIPMPVETDVTETVGASAGLWSSAADMSRYLIAQLGDGSDVGLTAQGQAQLHKPGAEIEPGFGYAMGWFHASHFLDLEFLQTLGTNLKSTDDLQVLFHEGDWKGYKSIVLMLPGQEYGVVLLMNINDATITSVYKNLAWDVTLIANGGEAYYFQPSEEPIVRYSRWIFSGLAFVLLAGWIWSWRRAHKPGKIRFAWQHILLILFNAGLLAYLYLILLPNNNASLRSLVDRSPDLGILCILVTTFALGWMFVSTWMLMKAQSK